MKFFSKLLIASAVGFATLPNSSLAEGLYATGSIGIANPGVLESTCPDGCTDELDFDAGLNFDAGIGYDFGNTIRVEATFERSSSDEFDVDYEGGQENGIEADVITNSFLASIYKDFGTDSKLTPFIGVSIGTSTTEDDGTFDDQKLESFVYGAQAGVSYEVSEKVDLFGKASYLLNNFDDITLGGDDYELEGFESLSAKMGLRFSF